MPAQLLAYLPDRPAVACIIDGEERVLVGRAPECRVRLDHPSVSRRHAELQRSGENWRLTDLGSKNGSYLNGQQVATSPVVGPAWLRFGDIACELTPLSAEEAANAALRLNRRRQDSVNLALRLEQRTALPDLLQDTLRAVCELADGERGFLLLAEDGGLRVRATHALDAGNLARREFSGSIGAVERAIARREPVVVNELGADPALGKRASVVAGGLQTLVCVPLLDGADVLGAVYTDSRRPGATITELDLELLQAFTTRAALWIAARRDARTLATLAAQPSWGDILAAHAGSRA
jgi:hypothetical protein